MSRQYPTQPRAAVGVVVFKGDDVLLIKRGKPPREDTWSLPGGAQRLGETVRDAAIREVLEETGVRIEITGLVDVLDSIHRDADGNVEYHYTLIDFVAVWRAGDPAAGSDAVDAKWVSVDGLADLGLWSETRRIIDAARRQLR